jgi:GNAT superfamily N-acetyltransferase
MAIGPEVTIEPFNHTVDIAPDQIAAMHLGVRIWQEQTGQNKFSDLHETVPDITELQERYVLPGGNFFIARSEEQVLGCIGLRHLDDGKGMLKRFAVVPSHQGEGIGSGLVGSALDWARNQDFKKLILHTNRSEQARHIYERAGFRVVDFLPDKGKSGDFVMELFL